MNNFPRIVALVGIASPFTRDDVERAFQMAGGKGRLELWGINRCYQKQTAEHPPFSRIYFADTIERFRKKDDLFADDFCRSLNALGIPIYAQKTYLEIPMSRPIPLQELIATGKDYFTSTVAYALAHAIAENVQMIMLHNVLLAGSSKEYIDQKPCIEFWTGLAMGRGIKVAISESSVIGKAYPWQARRYGFYPEPSPEDRDRLRRLAEMGLAPQVSRDREPQLSNERA